MLSNTAREVQEYVYSEAETLDSRLLADLRAEGIAVNLCDRESFLKAGQPLFEEFARDVPRGGELIDRALALSDGGP